MAFPKLTTILNKITSMTTRFRGQSATVRANFDYDVNVVKDYINNLLIPELDNADAANVKKTGDQTITGVKTFSSSPIVPTPTTDTQASTKKYVDDIVNTHKSSNDHDSRYYTETELGSTTDNSSGADKIGVTGIPTLAGGNVQTVLESVKGRLDNIGTTNANVEISNSHYAADGNTYLSIGVRIDSVDTRLASKANQTDINTTNSRVTVLENNKADKSEVTNVMTPKGNIAYASLPLTGNTIGWYYYCSDGDGTHGAGNYVWNGTTWYFGGTGDEGYNKLKQSLEYLSVKITLSNTYVGLLKSDGTISTQDLGFYIFEYPVSYNMILNINASSYYSTTDSFRAFAFYDTYDNLLNISNDAVMPNKKYRTIVPQNATKLVVLKYGSVEPEVSYNSYIEANTSYPLDKKINVPSKLYGIRFNENALNFVNRIFIEGIAARDFNFTINGEPSVLLPNDSNSVLIKDEYGNSVTKTITVTNTLPTVAQNKNVRIMCIGDSLTDAGYPAVAEAIFKHYNEIYGNINPIFVGNRIENRTIKLGDYSYTCRGCNQGESGYAVSDLLRKIIQCRGRFGTDSYSVMVGKTAWDSLGLATKTRNGVQERTTRLNWTTWNDDVGNQLRLACHGYYDADPSQELWNWIVNIRGVRTFTLDSVVYNFSTTYTTNDDNAQKAYIKYLCKKADEINSPFYDYDTVVSTNGVHAFNFGKYFDRYKTIDTNGNRLSDANKGSLVTDVNAYDVCAPSKVVIIMSENDYNNISDGTLIADDVVLMASLIKTYNSFISVAVGANRGYGVFNPDAYANMGCFLKFSVNKVRYDVDARLQTAVVGKNIDYLGLYAIQSPRNGRYKMIDTLTQNVIEYHHSENIHAYGELEYLDRAVLIVAWILSTLAS